LVSSDLNYTLFIGQIVFISTDNAYNIYTLISGSYVTDTFVSSMSWMGYVDQFMPTSLLNEVYIISSKMMVHCIFDYLKLQIKNEYLRGDGSSKIVISTSPTVHNDSTQC